MAAERVLLPDLLKDWPCRRRHLNQHYDEASAASRQWIQGFGFFDRKSQDAFDRCDFPKLAMLTYPYHNLAHSRTGCDLMTLFYVFDEYTDVEDELVTRQMADILMDGLRNPEKPRPQGECPLGEMARQYWALGRQTSTSMAETHFIETMQLYVDAVVQQSEDRMHDRVRTIGGYWEIRRHTSGCLPTFALIELELDFPEEIYLHPLLERLRDCALFSICAGNDLYSYNIERARGHALHNLVTTVMYAEDCDPQAAANWIGEWHDQIVRDFIQCRANLPSWGPDIDRQVTQYIDGLAYWVWGSEMWSFESHRYFGTQGLDIQKTREIYMRPRVDALSSRSPAHMADINAEEHMIAGMQIRRDRAKKGVFVEQC